MKEIEVKILNVSHKDLEPKLIELGAKKLFDEEFHAIFFDNVSSDIKNSNESLRIRKEGSKTFITHKKKISSKPFKIMDETEIEVSSFDDAKKLVEALGFKESGGIRKQRVSFKLNNVKFEFDKFSNEYDFVPEFLEIESDNVDEIYKYAKLLGFSEEDCKPWSGKDIIEHYS